MLASWPPSIIHPTFPVGAVHIMRSIRATLAAPPTPPTPPCPAVRRNAPPCVAGHHSIAPKSRRVKWLYDRSGEMLFQG
jgi:hypothetical protein